MDPLAERINAGGDLITKVITSGVGKTIMGGLGGVVVYTFYENRAEAIHTIITNPPVAIALGVGVVLALLGWLFRFMLTRVDDASTKTEHLKDDRIQELKGELIEARAFREKVTRDLEEIKRLMAENADRRQHWAEAPQKDAA